MKRLAATATIAAALTLAGCGTTTAAVSTRPATPTHTVKATVAAAATPKVTKARNPVTLLRKITGCKLDPSEHVGTVDRTTGGMTASCSFPGQDGDGNSVYMHTYTTVGQQNILMTAHPADDSDIIVVGDGFFARLVGTANYNNGYDFDVKPNVLAHELGGHVVK